VGKTDHATANRGSMRKQHHRILRAWVETGLFVLACGVATSGPSGAGREAAVPLGLPSSLCPIAVDGDPREALLFGALALGGFDPVVGAPDGRFRGYLLALPEGLYAAALDTVSKGQPLKAAISADGGDALLGEWVALGLRVGEEERLLLIAPGGKTATLDGWGRPLEERPEAWAGMDGRFGHTWAAEWLIPWEKVGVEPGGTFRVALVRGRKTPFGDQALEVLATTAPGRSSGRFGPEGAWFSRPAPPPPHPTGRLRPLASYEVRPFVPDAETERACRDAAPAGEFATAWLEVPPRHTAVRLAVEKAPAPAEFFRVDFWWQAGPREEQAALFPARAAKGEGDTLVAERLFPLPGGELRPSPYPTRVYVRMRVPRSTTPGTLAMTLRTSQPGGQETGIAWEVRVVPALPKTDALFGVFYLGTEAATWPADLQNLAAHGINAATCYAPDGAGQRRFVEMAGKAGIDGRFLMVETPGAPAGSWGYTADEPASAESIRRAALRASDLRARGLHPWATLCWPRSLELLPLLDGVALSPGMVVQAPLAPEAGRRWVCLMGGREDPGTIRRSVAGLSRYPGLSGFWVWCYASRPGDPGEWGHPYYREIACRASDGEGGLVDTVQWEALRDGIVDRRLAEAIQAQGRDPALAAPPLEPAREGRYWLPEGPFPHEVVRAGLADGWAQGSP